MFRFYSNPMRNTARVSVVGEYSKGTLNIAVARCSRKDTFMRRKGRAIAEGRLNKGKIYRKITMPKCDITMFVEIAKRVSAEVQQSKKVVNGTN